MPEEILNKEIVQELLKTRGEARGIHFKNDAAFVVKEKGVEGLKKVEKELEKVGSPINYKDIKRLNFYPLGLRIISLLGIQQALGWNDQKIVELCSFTPYISPIIRIYMKIFYSLEKVIKKAPRMWREYYTIGDLQVPDYDKEKGYAVLELKNFKLHPLFCRGMEGFLTNIVKVIVGTKNIKFQETKCVFRGGDCCQFKVLWK